MPELPEVENARRCLLRSGLPGRSFKRADIRWARTVKRPDLEEFVLGLREATVRDVQRRGKYILLPLDVGDQEPGPTFMLHLGMSGGLRVEPASIPEPPMVRHSFSLDDGQELRFVDGRKFGKLWLVDDPAEVLPPLSPDPLGDGFTVDVLAKSLTGRRAPIKALLLEQSVTAGLGNLYADESLYLSGIHPERPASDLSLQEVTRLRESIFLALTEGVAIYDRARDETWPDPPRALTAWTIPRKEGEACHRCDTPMAVTRVRARTTWFCPRHQE